MGAVVDFAFYYNVYLGQEADQASFPALCARAEDVIGAMTRWQVTDETIGGYPAQIQTLYKKAVCAEIDHFAVNGLDSVAGGSDRGFTVGKVSVNSKSVTDTIRKGAMDGHVSPIAVMYLEQTGLLNSAVPVVGGWVC